MTTQIPSHSLPPLLDMQFSEAPEHLRPFWEDFFVALAEGIEKISSAWQEKNLKQLAAQVHNYKGQAMLFQYDGFRQRLQQLEHQLSSRHFNEIEAMIADLKNYFQHEEHRYEEYKNCHC